jgi:hypothetical protein
MLSLNTSSEHTVMNLSSSTIMAKIKPAATTATNEGFLFKTKRISSPTMKKIVLGVIAVISVVIAVLVLLSYLNVVSIFPLGNKSESIEPSSSSIEKLLQWKKNSLMIVFMQK